MDGINPSDRKPELKVLDRLKPEEPEPDDDTRPTSEEAKRLAQSEKLAQRALREQFLWSMLQRLATLAIFALAWFARARSAVATSLSDTLWGASSRPGCIPVGN